MSGTEVKADLGGGFYHHLYRGADLLEAGRAAEAAEEFDRALALQPDNPEALSQQAAALFKLERYDDAVGCYSKLIEMNPRESTLHVNLALVYIKTGQLDEAEGSLREGLACGGDSKRLHRYLGLVYSKKNEFEKALIAFNKAGSAKMVAEMEELIRKRQSGISVSEREMQRVKELADDTGVSNDEEELAPAPPKPKVDDEDAAERRRRLLRLTPMEQNEQAAVGTQPVSSVALGGPYRMPLARPNAPALRLESPALLRIGIEAGVIAMPADAVLLHGKVRGEPLYKRFKGRTTTSIFGPREAPFCEIKGEGSVLLQPRSGVRLCLFEIEGKEKAFVVEQALYAFTGNLTWENGRIGSTEEESFDLVTLTGGGSFALRSAGEITEVQVEDDDLAVARHALLGWTGKLLPRIIAVPDGFPADGGPVVRLKGTGRVFVGTLPR